MFGGGIKRSRADKSPIISIYTRLIIFSSLSLSPNWTTDGLSGVTVCLNLLQTRGTNEVMMLRTEAHENKTHVVEPLGLRFWYSDLDRCHGRRVLCSRRSDGPFLWEAIAAPSLGCSFGQMICEIGNR